MHLCRCIQTITDVLKLFVFAYAKIGTTNAAYVIFCPALFMIKFNCGVL